MKRSILLSVMTILLTAFSGCSKPCPKPVYPELEAIDKVPTIEIIIKDGTMDSNSTLKAFKTIKALRVSEHYYYTLISDYRKDFM